MTASVNKETDRHDLVFMDLGGIWLLPPAVLPHTTCPI